MFLAHIFYQYAQIDNLPTTIEQGESISPIFKTWWDGSHKLRKMTIRVNGVQNLEIYKDVRNLGSTSAVETCTVNLATGYTPGIYRVTMLVEDSSYNVVGFQETFELLEKPDNNSGNTSGGSAQNAVCKTSIFLPDDFDGTVSQGDALKLRLKALGTYKLKKVSLLFNPDDHLETQYWTDINNTYFYDEYVIETSSLPAGTYYLALYAEDMYGNKIPYGSEATAEFVLKEKTFVQLPLDMSMDDWERLTTQKFGNHRTYEDKDDYHLAVDVGAEAEDEVDAFADGLVKYSDYMNGYGGLVIIEHNFGGEYVCSLYGHLNHTNLTKSVGDVVKAGEKIGEIGDGDTNGGYWGRAIHIHFGIRKGSYNAFNRYGHKCDEDGICYGWKNYWSYAGYSRNGNNTIGDQKTDYDFTHEDIVAEWYDPTEFIKTHLLPVTFDHFTGWVAIDDLDVTVDLSEDQWTFVYGQDSLLTSQYIVKNISNEDVAIDELWLVMEHPDQTESVEILDTDVVIQSGATYTTSTGSFAPIMDHIGYNKLIARVVIADKEYDLGSKTVSVVTNKPLVASISPSVVKSGQYLSSFTVTGYKLNEAHSLVINDSKQTTFYQFDVDSPNQITVHCPDTSSVDVGTFAVTANDPASGSAPVVDSVSDESSTVAMAKVTVKPTYVGEYVNSLGMYFNLIKAGEFLMLGTKRVILTNDFYMQTTEVTQGQWKAIMGSNPSYNQECGDECPVENISWDEIQEFINKLNTFNEGVYRLPTEAEWEYAARAGATTSLANGNLIQKYCGYDANMDAIGWYCGNSHDIIQPVGKKQPNNWGLFDMHGNVWEWCLDWYQQNLPWSYAVDPLQSNSDRYKQKALRGGSVGGGALACTFSFRIGNNGGYRDRGFRLLRQH